MPAAAAANNKKLRLDRARRRKLNGKNGFVAIPCSALLCPRAAKRYASTPFVQIIARFVCSLVRRK
jgi:hypothetical protein